MGFEAIVKQLMRDLDLLRPPKRPANNCSRCEKMGVVQVRRSAPAVNFIVCLDCYKGTAYHEYFDFPVSMPIALDYMGCQMVHKGAGRQTLRRLVEWKDR